MFEKNEKRKSIILHNIIFFIDVRTLNIYHNFNFEIHFYLSFKTTTYFQVLISPLKISLRKTITNGDKTVLTINALPKCLLYAVSDVWD